jgi:sulfur relay (sulfurtransferase) complex TusBCD TusD component (DsrE family)
MKFGVMVLEGPYQHQAADSAYYFVRAALARGQQIVRGMKPDIKMEHVQLSGLGALADYLRQAERFVTFGD